MGAIIVVDAFWGDSGEGKVSAWLARHHSCFLCAPAPGPTPDTASSSKTDGRSGPSSGSVTRTAERAVRPDRDGRPDGASCAMAAMGVAPSRV